MQDESASDGALAAKALAGEDRAFTLLMRRTKEPLYRFARRHIGDDGLAYDMVQQAFISAWRSLRRYDAAYPFEAWMRTIVRNKCRDEQRKARVRRWISFSPVTGSGIKLDAPEESADPERTTSDRDELARAKAAIAALPDGLKTPLILTALEGLTMAEAARELGLTEKAVESRIYRARKKLVEVLG
ncbi:RNA polymerase subunit sigma-24 [Oceanicaulis sp. 350]|nr:RNA polymerase subunit sigma-24 [Oceanicaulis sp. 350]